MTTMSQASARLARFHLASWWNWRNSNLGRLIEPIIYYAFLCTSLGNVVSVVGGEVAYLRFTFVGMLGYISLRAGISTLVDVANDRKWGVYALARLGGHSFYPYLASVAAVNVLIMTIQVAALVIVAAIINIHIVTAGLIAISVLALVASVLWTCLGCLLAFGVSSYSMRDLLSSLSLLPIALTAPIFYPRTSMPAVVRGIGYMNPLSYELGFLRAALNRAIDWPSLAAYIAITVTLFSCLIAVAGRAALVSGEVS